MFRIGTKLGIGNGVLVALCLITGLVSYRQTQVVRLKVDEVTNVREPVNSAMYALRNALTESAFATLGYLASGDSALLAAFRETREQSVEIQRRVRETEIAPGDSGVSLRLQHGLQEVQTLAEAQIALRDQQTRAMQTLLQDLDEVDKLLTERIQASVTAEDPVAYRRIQSVLEMKASVNGLTKGLGSFLATGDPQFERRILQAERGFEHYYAVYRVVLISSDEKRWSAELRHLSTRSIDEVKSAIALEKQRRKQIAEFLSSFRDVGTMLDDRLLRHSEQNLLEAKADLLQAGDRANSTILIALILSVAFGVGTGYLTTRSITIPLRMLSSAMLAIARGDRAQTVDLTTSDELRALGDAFNLMTGHLLRANQELRDEIASRRQAEDELRRSEERFRTIFEDAPIGIGLTNSGERIEHTNAAFQDMLGYDGAELARRTLAEIIDPAEFVAHRPPSFPANDGSFGRYQSEVPCRRKDGTTAWMNLNVSRIRTDPGHPANSIIMMEDITDRRATEQKVRLLAHTITSMHESVVLADSNDTILSVNPAFCGTYGYDESECVGLTTERLALWTGFPPRSDVLSRPQQAGGWTGELIATRKNGEQFPVRVSTSVLRDDAGSPKAMVVISRDITDQKQMERKLNIAERDRLSALRSFALSVQRAQEDERARISRELHDDLCQRLTGMKFRVEVLEDQLVPANRRAGRRLRDFVLELDRTIVDVRRISSNLRPSVLDDFGLVTALKLLCRDFETTHSIRTIFEEGTAPSRRVDPSIEIALYRIAQEALSNVARHAGATAVTLRLIDDHSRLCLSVEDDGKGFDRESVAKSRSAGHGIGLVSMRERTELLGGVFDVQSGEVKGTVICSTIPLGGDGNNEKSPNSDR